MSLDVWAQEDVRRLLRGVQLAQAGVLARIAPDTDLSGYVRGCADTLAAVREAFGIDTGLAAVVYAPYLLTLPEAVTDVAI